MDKSQKEIRVIKVYQKQQGLLTPPKHFIDTLGWKNGDELFITFYEDSLVVTDIENFKKLDSSKIKNMRRTSLTGNHDSSKYHYFTFRIVISRHFVEEFGLQNNCHVELTLEDNKLIIKKYE